MWPEYVPQNAAHLRREQAVNERIGGGIQRRQALDERRNGDVCLRLRNALEYLQQIENDVRRPADNEHYGEVWKREVAFRITSDYNLASISTSLAAYLNRNDHWLCGPHWPHMSAPVAVWGPNQLHAHKFDLFSSFVSFLHLFRKPASINILRTFVQSLGHHTTTPKTTRDFCEKFMFFCGMYNVRICADDMSVLHSALCLRDAKLFARIKC